MKKFTLFVILAMVLICSCAAQNANAECLFVVTWTGGGLTWVFNANGGLTVGNSYGRYTGTRLFIWDNWFNISIHSNGRKIILSQNNSNGCIVLTKY